MEQKNILLGILILITAVFTAIVYYDKTSKNGSLNPGHHQKPNWQWTDEWGNGSAKPAEPTPAPITPLKPEEPAPTPATQTVADSYTDAVTQAKAKGMPVFIMFTADWCGWCKKMKDETLKDDKVQTIMKNYIMVYVNTDQDRETTRKFKVEGLPTFVISNGDGDNIKSISGYKNADEFYNWLNNPDLFKQKKETPKPTKPERRRILPFLDNKN